MSIRVPITAAIGALAIATATAYAAFGHTTAAQQLITTGTMDGATNQSSAQLTGLSTTADFAWTPSTTPGITDQIVMKGDSAGGLFSPYVYLSPTASTARVTGGTYNADRYLKVRSWRGSWYSESAVWSAHSLPMASGTDRVSGTGSGTALTGPWTTAGTNLAALATQDSTRYQPPSWASDVSSPTGGVYVDATHAWIIGAQGQVRKFDGTNWVAQTLPLATGVYAITFVDANNGWVAGASGTVFHTTDGGATWTIQHTGVNKVFNNISCSSTSFCMTTSDSGTAFVTTNGGLTWTDRSQYLGGLINGVDCVVGTTTCWTAEYSGAIRKTVDGGVNWMLQTSGTTAQLQSVTCIDTSKCWVSGGNGTLLRTTNGGTNWTPVATGTTNTFMSVEMVNATVGYLGGALGLLWKTTDGGTTWSTLTAPPSQTFTDLSCISVSDCLGVTYTATFLTHDGGDHWSDRLPGYIELVPRTPALATSTTVTSAKVTLSYRTTTTPVSGTRIVLLASADNGVSWSTFELPAPSGANVDVTTTADIKGIGFTPASRAQQVRLRVGVQPANGTQLDIQMDLVHLNIN